MAMSETKGGQGADHPDELLPWYVNGTLDDDEQRRVAAHLDVCGRCRAEVEWLRALRAGVKQATGATAPGELGLKRLQRDLRRESRSGVSHWWRPAFAAAALLLVVQSAVLVRHMGTSSPAVLRPLGVGGQPQVLQVTFAPQAREQQIRNLLQTIDAELVGGPGTVGVYRLRVEGGAEAVREAIAELEARPALVTHVSKGGGS